VCSPHHASCQERRGECCRTVHVPPAAISLYKEVGSRIPAAGVEKKKEPSKPFYAYFNLILFLYFIFMLIELYPADTEQTAIAMEG
jgi:uncharacterized membrane protein